MADTSTVTADNGLPAHSGSTSQPANNSGDVYSSTTFSELYEKLLSKCGNNAPLLPAVAPFAKTSARTIRAPELGKEIANLSLHPTLEAALHILNLDLPSAHFLLRHMQGEPAWEGMFLHGILHRVEGDYDNARAWYRDVKDSEVFTYAWGKSSESESESRTAQSKKGIDAALGMIADIQSLNQSGQGDREELESRSLDEIRAVVAFCAKKFGVHSVADAREAWTRNEGKIDDKAQAMVVGGEGWRQF
ncbi:hypothetical protein GJ744_006736 [Endocarpon pusillum]|uniref:Uncharacterized protein n=1 Tax=Endocarpon pusillum TaxID=364733 RepID=A0A8H7AP48_9EURO|nr:hypothetical protein GJ744_006736 [Endocarpon pusillum]